MSHTTRTGRRAVLIATAAAGALITGCSSGSQPASNAGASGTSTGAIEMLKQDHRKVEGLFEQFEQADDEQKERLVEQICAELIVHTKLEEEIFYPACREAGVEDEKLDESQVEQVAFDPGHGRVAGQVRRHRGPVDQGQLGNRLGALAVGFDRTGGQQFAGQPGPDEARAAGDEHIHHKVILRAGSPLRLRRRDGQFWPGTTCHLPRKC